MIELTALFDTVIKSRPVDSSQLEPEQKQSIKKSSKVKVISTRKVGNLIEARMPDNTTKFFYSPHWTGQNQYYPKGQLRPDIVANPTKAQTIDAIIRYCRDVGVTQRHHIAYVLATAEGESNFKAIREIRGRQLTSDQLRYWNTGYYGRGMIQVTWKSNYAKIDSILGTDLVRNPDQLLEPSMAISTLVLGMRDGWYTGKRLSHYSTPNYYSMRAIVNPGEIKYYPSRNAKFVSNAVKWEKHLATYY